MKRIVMLLVVSIFVIPCAWPQVPTKEQILFGAHLYRIESVMSGETSLDEPIWAGAKPLDAEQEKSFTLFTTGHFKLAENRLDIDDKGWRWNDSPFPVLLGELPTSVTLLPENQIHLVCCPTMQILSGESGQISIGSQGMDYFEKRSDGLFELKKFSDSMGLKINLQPTMENDKIHLSNFTFSLTSAESREPIPGVALQVGKPILKIREYALDLRVSRDKDYGIILHPKDGQQGLLMICFRVKVVPPEVPVAKTEVK